MICDSDASKDFRDLFQAIIASCFQHLVPDVESMCHGNQHLEPDVEILCRENQHLVPDVMIRELKCSQEARRTEGAEKMVIPRL